MCGRYVLTASGEELASLFGLGSVPAILKRYNVAPGQEAPVLVSDQRSKAIVNAVWGWSRRDGRPRSSASIINARAETARSKPAFHESIGRRRLVVPASGFLEWTTEPGRGRVPHLFRREDGAPMALAGLFEDGAAGPIAAPGRSHQLSLFEPREQRGPDRRRRFVIVTTAATSTVRRISRPDAPGARVRRHRAMARCPDWGRRRPQTAP